MAQSTWASGLQVSRGAKQLWYEAGKEIYWKIFMADVPNFMIHHKHEHDGKSEVKDGNDVLL